jgi:DNA-binding response OmpR family regulator/c-di-GMP-binding flagellar brake protein YcgR
MGSMSLSRPPANQISIADKVDLKLPDENGRMTIRLKALVERVDPTEIQVALVRNQPLPLGTFSGPDIIVKVIVFKGDYTCVFDSKVLRRLGGKRPGFLLERPNTQNIRQAPRRDFFRVETRLPVLVRPEDSEQGGDIVGTISNLSAGGCRLELPQSLPSETAVFLDFELPASPNAKGFDPLHPVSRLPGLIRDVVPLGAQGDTVELSPKRFAVGIEFASCSRFERRILMDFVNYSQRQYIKQKKDPDASATIQDPIEGHALQPAQDRELQQDEVQDLDQKTTGYGPDNEATPEVPAADEGESSVTESALRPPKGPANGKTVLVVEDEEGIREILCEVLQYEGYNLLVAGDGEAALNVIDHLKVDLVITDLMMPRMNGWRLIKRLRANVGRVPVIVITGYIHSEGEAILNSGEIDAFLVKPLDLSELVAKTNALLFPDLSPRRKRVLLMDNDVALRQVLEDGLLGLDFRVETASSFQEGLDLILSFKPDLILLDLFAAEMDGLNFCRVLRSRASTVGLPILAVSKFAGDEHIRQALAAKVSGLLVKPLGRDRLLERMRHVLQRGQSR